MKPEATLYEILEVSPHANAQVIRAAYRCLAQSNHPDKNCGSAAASARQAQLNLAYAVLSDVRRRLRYDQRLRAQQASDIEPSRQGSGDTGARKAPGWRAGGVARLRLSPA